MAEPTIEDRIRAENPSFTVSEDQTQRVISPESDPDTYEAMIADRVALAVVQAEQEAADELRRAVQQRVQAARADLEMIVSRSNQAPNLTQAEMKAGFRLLATTLDDLVAYLDRTGGLG